MAVKAPYAPNANFKQRVKMAFGTSKAFSMPSIPTKLHAEMKAKGIKGV